MMKEKAKQLGFEGIELSHDRDTPAMIGGSPAIQITHGYLLKIDQVGIILSAISKRSEQSRISKDELVSDTGFAELHVETLCRIAVGIGLIKRVSYSILPLGTLIYKYDKYFEDTSSLWVVHYRLGSNPHNLVWQKLANNTLHEIENVSTTQALNSFADIINKSRAESIERRLKKEIRSFFNAYIEQDLLRLHYLYETNTNTYSLKIGHAPVHPLILLFAIYDYRDRFLTGDTAIEIPTLIEEENSPGRVLDLKESRFRDLLNQLHNEGYISIERQHDLDQITLSDDYSALKVLQRYYAEQS